MPGFLFIAGVVLLGIGSIMLLIEAFGAGMLWGFGTLLLPLPVALLFVATHWYEAKRAFFIQVTGLALFLAAGRAT